MTHSCLEWTLGKISKYSNSHKNHSGFQTPFALHKSFWEGRERKKNSATLIHKL